MPRPIRALGLLLALPLALHAQTGREPQASNALTTAVLDALLSCVHGSEVAAVKVTIDGRTHVMECHQIAS